MDNAFLLLAAGMAGGAGLHWWLANRAEHSSHPKAAPDLVGWEHLAGEAEQGIIRMQDGALLASYSYTGQDMAAAEASHRSQLSQQINRFINDFENGWVFYFTNIRRPSMGYPSSDGFPDPLSWAIDQERKKAAGAGNVHFNSTFYFSVVWKPEFTPDVQDFEARLRELETNLSLIFSVRRLPAAEHLSYLYESMHGIRQPVTPPRSAEPIDTLLANQEIQVLPIFDERSHPIRSKLRIPSDSVIIDGGRYIRVISITGYPSDTYNGVLNDLNSLDFSYRWTQRIIPMDRLLQKKKITSIREKFRYGRFSMGKVVSSTMNDGSPANERMEQIYESGHTFKMMEEASAALEAVEDGQSGFAQSASTIILCEEDYERIEAKTQRVLHALRKAGFTGTVERFGQLKAWIGSLPGHGSDNLRNEFISTYNIADCIPSWNMYTGQTRNPSKDMQGAQPHWQGKTREHEPFTKHNPSSGNVGHKIIVGATGAGKSVFVNFELAQWLRHPGAQVYLLDRGYTGYLMCQAVGGEHYDLLNDNSIAFQPLRDIDDPKHLKWSADWLARMLSLHGLDLTPTQQHKSLFPALTSLAEQPPEVRTITSLIGLVQDEQIRQTLSVYGREGQFGHILDSSNENLQQSHYQVFELETLMGFSDNIRLPVLDYIFWKIERSLDRRRPTMIYIEEAWQAFDHKVFAERLKSWLLTLRKYNGHVGLVTHSPAQLQTLDNHKLYIESAPERVFLPNPDATSPDTSGAYKMLGLNEAQLHTIANITARKHYYLHSPAGSNTIDLDLGPLALALLTDPGNDSVSQRIDRVSRLKATHKERWPIYWLREIGRGHQADLLEAAFRQYTERKGTPKTTIETNH